MIETSPPAPFPTLTVGVGVPVTLRATVQRGGTILWSADAPMTEDGSGYVGTGATPSEALDNLGHTLAFHAVPVSDDLIR